MAQTRIEGGDWPTKLAEAVAAAQPGDVIQVPTWHAAQLGHTAALRLRGAEHGIVFKCGDKRVDYADTDDPPLGTGFDADGYPVGAAHAPRPPGVAEHDS